MIIIASTNSKLEVGSFNKHALAIIFSQSFRLFVCGVIVAVFINNFLC
jgi:hypothetical protein